MSFFVGGLVPPAVQEGHFDDGEFVFGVVGEFGDDCVDGVDHSCELGAHVGSVEVVVDCFQPSDVVVGVRDEVDRQIGSSCVFLGVVGFHHLVVGEAEVAEGGGSQQQDQKQKRCQSAHNSIKRYIDRVTNKIRLHGIYEKYRFFYIQRKTVE